MNRTIETGREYLKKNKPLVYEKILAHENEKLPIIQLQYRYACNFRCKHCSIDTVKNSCRESINANDLKSLSDQAHELGIARFVITGGEPLILSNLGFIVRSIDPNKFYINIDTNGWFLTKDKAVYLKGLGIDRVQLSIDNLYPDQHDDFRQAPGSHKRAIEAIDNSLEAGLDLFIQTVVTKERLYTKEFKEFIEYFNSRNIKVFVTFAKPAGAWAGKTDMLVDYSDVLYMEELEEKYDVCTHLTPGYNSNRERMCIAGNNIISVTQYGDVLACPYFYCSLGNIKNEPFADILKRIKSLKVFRKPTCLIAADKEFISKYTPRVDGKELPVSYKEVFSKEDFDEC